MNRKTIVATLVVALTLVATATAGRIKVRPGETKTNGDVTVTNNSDSDGKAVIRPEEPTDDESDVGLGNGFKGKVSGVDVDDVIRLGPNNETEISCNGGGEIILGGDSNVTVSNDDSGGHVVVIQPDGTPYNVNPGETKVFDT